jgi:thiol:disulfide interchange protein
MKYNIMSVPSMLFFKNGEIKDQVVGAVPAEHLSEKLNGLL